MTSTDSSSLLYFTLFADDTTILHTSPNCDTLIDSLNSELLQVISWFRANKLSLNHTKTNSIFFSKSTSPVTVQLPPEKIDTIPINRVFSTKFLGVFVDYKLSWTEHSPLLSKLPRVILGFFPSYVIFFLLLWSYYTTHLFFLILITAT